MNAPPRSDLTCDQLRLGHCSSRRPRSAAATSATANGPASRHAARSASAGAAAAASAAEALPAGAAARCPVAPSCSSEALAAPGAIS